MNPGAVSSRDNALRSQNDAILAGIQDPQGIFHVCSLKFLVGLHTPGGKHLVRMVVMMVMVVAAAGAVLIMAMMLMLLVVVMTVAAVMLVFLVLVVVVTVAAVMLVFLILVVVVTMAAVVLVLLVFVVVVTVAAVMLVLLVLVMVVMVMLMGLLIRQPLLLQLCQLRCQRSLALHSLRQLFAGKLVPGSRYDGCLIVVRTDQLHRGIQLGLRNGIRPGEDNCGCGFDLVVIEFTEILHIDLDLTCVTDCHRIAQSHVLIGDLLHRADHIGQLANAGGLNDDPLGIVLLDNLGQSLSEVTHQRAADAAGVHLRNIDARILEKAAVDADLTEFVFNQDKLLALVGLGDHLFNQRGFTGTQEAGINVNFHKNTFCIKFFSYIIPPFDIIDKSYFSGIFYQQGHILKILFVAFFVGFCYTYVVMEKKTHLYVSRKNVLTWLMALCLAGSAVTRIVFACLKGSGEYGSVWSQIVLPVAAALVYLLIVLLNGDELFYKTAIPVWMATLYGALWISSHESSRMMVCLYWIALIFFAFLYTQITCGMHFHGVFFLLPITLVPVAFTLYFYRESIWQGRWGELMCAVPDLLMLLGVVVLVFAIRVHPLGEYHPTWGDRKDGRRLRSLPAMSQVSPYIMVTRNTSTNFFEDSFEITHIDRYIRQKRREGLTSFGITHVLLACYVRAVCRYPGLNRFLAGQKVYSRGNDIQYCMTIKKEMRADSPDTVIKVHLSPSDTAEDVYNKLQAAVENVKNTPLDSNFDNTAGVLTMIPGVFLKFVVWLLRTLDYFGLLPAFLLEVSPFHGSLFFTSMGSLGIPPIYHHLYDFGNLPVFGSFGCKRRATEVMEDGSVVQRKYVDVKFCLDERIVDGYYYAAFFKHYKRILAHPEVLDNPPEEILSDID